MIWRKVSEAAKEISGSMIKFSIMKLHVYLAIRFFI